MAAETLFGLINVRGVHGIDFLQTHSLLNRAAQLQETLADFVSGQLVDRTKPTIAEVMNVVNLASLVTDPESHDVLHRVDEVLRIQRHLIV